MFLWLSSNSFNLILLWFFCAIIFNKRLASRKLNLLFLLVCCSLSFICCRWWLINCFSTCCSLKCFSWLIYWGFRWLLLISCLSFIWLWCHTRYMWSSCLSKICDWDCSSCCNNTLCTLLSDCDSWIQIRLRRFSLHYWLWSISSAFEVMLLTLNNFFIVISILFNNKMFLRN